MGYQRQSTWANKKNNKETLLQITNTMKKSHNIQTENIKNKTILVVDKINTTKNALNHLEQGLDIMAVITAEITIQITKLLEKSSQFFEDTLNREVNKNRRKKRH